jgi:ATP-dependent helicase HrpA
LSGFKVAVFAQAVRDIQAQIQALQPTDFLQKVPFERWQHFPRYMKALQVRLEKLANNVAKDDAASTELAKRWQQYEARADSLQKRDIVSPVLEDYRWLLEEYRVSLFAQTVKTAVPVSTTRLDKRWAEIPS